MIAVEGFKAFSGEMLITPRNPNFKPFTVKANWLYKPDTGCWYGKGSSYMEAVCTPLTDVATEAEMHIMGLEAKIKLLETMVPKDVELGWLKTDRPNDVALGMPVWCLDRIRLDGSVTGLVRGTVIAVAPGALVISAADYDNLDSLLKSHYEETLVDGNTALLLFPVSQCFRTEALAWEALKKGRKVTESD